jgi:hypothetical protein
MTKAHDVASLVGEQVRRLQAGYVTPKRQAWAVASLAELRRAASVPIGADW